MSLIPVLFTSISACSTSAIDSTMLKYWPNKPTVWLEDKNVNQYVVSAIYLFILDFFFQHS